MKLSWEVDGVHIVVEKLEDGLEAGMEKAVDQILENLERDAKDRIAVRPWIFTGEVYGSFTDQTGTADSSSGHSSRFINSAKHAGALEHGVHPSKYADGAPPISALMPWVLVNLADWNINTGDGDGGSSIKTPIAGENNPDTTNTIEDAGYESGWNRFHKNGNSSPEHLWLGQRVTVYDGQSYREGEISHIDLHGDATVDFDTGGDMRLSWRNGYDQQFDRGLVAGEDWYSLTDREQRDIAQDMFDSTVSIENFNSEWETKVNDSFSQYVENIADPAQVKQMAIGISRISKDDTMSKRGVYTGDETGGFIKLNTGNSDIDTSRHELAHAWAVLNGYEKPEGARYTDQNGPDWNVFRLFAKDRNLPWNYEEIGKGNWETKQGNELPHPTTYMIHSPEKRENVDIFDDVNHEGFDKWEEYIRTRTKKQATQAESDIESPDYDPFFGETQVLDPNGGAAQQGDALKFETGGKTYEVKLESGVYQTSETSTGWAIDISRDGSEQTIAITNWGEIDKPGVTFLEYAPGGAKFLRNAEVQPVEDLPDDPGFASGEDDPFAWFIEALNRDQWAGMIAAEKAQERVRSSFYTRSDGYSHIGTQEGIAHFMAVVFDRGDGTNNAESYVVDLYNRSPELIYIANQAMDFSPEIQEVLEDETGMSFEALMDKIEREHIA